MRLDLLPTSGLDLSVLLAVLAGTLVLFGLSESLGWAFGGLVVPGYLASVFVVSPAAGVTVLAEASLTLAVVVLLSDGLSRTGVWSPFFGRERFLLLVVVSVLVRQTSEIWLWPAVLSHQGGWFGADLVRAGEAHSVGLVLVPLTANALGKGGWKGGIAQLLIPTVLAWVVLRYVLLTHTNVSLSAMALTYEDVSLDFLGSARAYFVLACGAFIAARFNGAFAWSAGGILIPALLGLAWYEPTRVFVTFGEAVVIALAFRGLTTLPVIRHWNLEGVRKLVILIFLSGGFRLGLAWLHEAGLVVRSEELTGLGYLLSALMALKILQFRSVPTMVLPALGTSLLAFVGGSTGAWALEQVFPTRHDGMTLEPEPATTRLLASPEAAIEFARVRARLDPARAPSVHLPAARRSTWQDVWGTFAAGLRDPAFAPTLPDEDWVSVTWGSGEFAGRPWLIVRESAERFEDVEGWGVGLARVGAAGPVLLVEHPWTDPDSARASVARCAAIDCAVLYVSGMDLPSGTDDARDALLRVLTGPVERAHFVASNPAAAAEALPATRGVGEVVTAALVATPGTWHASASELEFLTSALVPTLAAWADGEVGLDEVRMRAEVVGLQVTEVAGCGSDPCVALTPVESGPILVVRRGGAPTVVAVSHPMREIGTLKFALGAFDSLGATALVVDPSVDPLPPEPTRDPMQAVHLGWRRAFSGRPDAPVALWFRGLGAGLPGEARPSEDVVIGAGRPAFGEPPAALAALEVDGKLAGVWTARWAAAAIDEPGLAGDHLAGPEADLDLGGMTPAVLWFSDAARERWRSDDRATVNEWVGAAGLALVDGSGAAPLDASSSDRPRGGGQARFDVLAALARRAAHQHNLNLLRKLAEAANADTAVRVGWEPTRLLAWLEVEVRDGAAVWSERAWLVPGDGREVVLPSDATADEIRSALGWMPADLRFQPVSP